MSDVSDRRPSLPPLPSPVPASAGAVTVTHVDGTLERLSMCSSRELVLRRLLARGLSPATLRILLPERRRLLDAITG